MMTAEQYYTQPEGDALHITISKIQDIEWGLSEGETLSLSEQGILHFGNQQDTYICRDCDERKGWHWHSGPADGSDYLAWEGDFYVLDEEETILCEYCLDDLSPKDDDEGPSNLLDTLPSYTLACMDLMEKISKF